MGHLGFILWSFATVTAAVGDFMAQRARRNVVPLKHNCSSFNKIFPPIRRSVLYQHQFDCKLISLLGFSSRRFELLSSKWPPAGPDWAIKPDMKNVKETLNKTEDQNFPIHRFLLVFASK